MSGSPALVFVDPREQQKQIPGQSLCSRRGGSQPGLICRSCSVCCWTGRTVTQVPPPGHRAGSSPPAPGISAPPRQLPSLPRHRSWKLPGHSPRPGAQGEHSPVACGESALQGGVHLRLLVLQENTVLTDSQAGSEAAVPSSWTLCEAPPGFLSLPLAHPPHMDGFRSQSASASSTQGA